MPCVSSARPACELDVLELLAVIFISLCLCFSYLFTILLSLTTTPLTHQKGLQAELLLCLQLRVIQQGVLSDHHDLRISLLAHENLTPPRQHRGMIPALITVQFINIIVRVPFVDNG